MDLQEASTPKPFLGPLSKKERRILGVLIEKALTTPEYYPLTLKALATGCNQKNNRSPLSSYEEYDLEESLDQLRSRGLIASVQTAGGRTERYRHLLRDAAGWNNRQLAIMGELLLRGRQQTGELRTRASRMAPIESLEDLRIELEALQNAGYLQSTGELQRRGIEVDHTLYLPEENKTLHYESPSNTETADRPAPSVREALSDNQVSSPPRPQATQQSENRELRAEIDTLRESLQALTERVSDLERQLGL